MIETLTPQAYVFLPVQQVQEMINSAVFNGLNQKHEQQIQKKELSKRETAQLLNVSKATIDNWSDAGILTKHHRGRICYFLYSEVMDSKTSLKKYSRKDLQQTAK